MKHEMIDEYNTRGEKIGIVDKAVAHEKGLWHKSVHVWIINDKNEILLQYRSAEKDLYPNTWDCSFAGHIDTGESSIEAVLREGKEELDIDVNLENLQYVFTNREMFQYGQVNSNEFVDIYILRQNINLQNVELQKEEVSNAKYVSKEQFFELMKNGTLIPHKIEYMVLKEILK